jgi:hypothetical protein
MLAGLYTDAWVAPNTLASMVAVRSAPRLLDRYEPALADANVITPSLGSLVLQEMRAHRAGNEVHWPPIIAMNDWFGQAVIAKLKQSDALRDQPVVFAYSYAAKTVLELARSAGCQTVLGQIDPGPYEDELVAQVAKRHGISDLRHERPPALYWDLWRTECELADLIVVNSRWCAGALVKVGVDPAKLAVVPLAQAQFDHASYVTPRHYPERFTIGRPLRMLFLGQFGVRKGAIELLEAIRGLRGAPVRLTIVGPIQVEVEKAMLSSGQIEWVGAVRRRDVSKHYQTADVFILPTHSDGFALTQLEAQAHGLPVLATRFCGEVVVDNVNGRLIEPLTVQRIGETIRWALENPRELQRMSVNSRKRTQEYTPRCVIDRLITVVEEQRGQK